MARRVGSHTSRMRSPGLFLALLLVLNYSGAAVQTSVITNRAPLKPKAFNELPLGAIQPRGWLRTQLERQRDG